MPSWFRLGRRTDPKVQLERALGGYELPSFPRVATEVLTELRRPDGDLGAAADRLAEDPGLSARVLALANSSAFALRHPVKNVTHAISLLGRSDVESLVLAVVVQRTLPRPSVAGYDPGRFWRSAARRAATARAVADLAHPSTRSESFTASLLGDMAIPLLAASHGERYGQVLRAWHAEGGNLATLEREALACDHAHVAGWVAQQFQFPTRLADAIGAHHDEEGAADLPPAIPLVAPLGEEPEHGVEAVLEGLHQALGLPYAEVEALLSEAFAQADEIAARMV